MLLNVENQDWSPSIDELLAIFDGVSFTAEDSEMMLSVVNTATRYQLYFDAELDGRAVESILMARPFYSLVDLSSLESVTPDLLEQLHEYSSEFLNHDIRDGSFVLTDRLAVYYLDLMLTVLWDDRDFFEKLATIAAIESNDVERIVRFIECEMKYEIIGRVGTVYPSEQELLDELYTVLETLQGRSEKLLLN